MTANETAQLTETRQLLGKVASGLSNLTCLGALWISRAPWYVCAQIPAAEVFGAEWALTEDAWPAPGSTGNATVRGLYPLVG